jgi:MoaA/NifB/PqqE/SkfB family radical SAM enzyme
MSNVWKYKDLSSVHIELSSRCQAACPVCPRFLRNSPNIDPNLVETSITFKNFKKWFPIEITKNIKTWTICGTHGDPFSCKDLYEILEYICENSSGYIQVNTNGGLRNPSYFKKIGELFSRYNTNSDFPDRFVIFSIDGLKTTNHIYRRNVVWEKVWENLMAYVSTGASTQWDYLVFGHNLYQVEKARAIAKSHNIRFTLKNPFGVDQQGMSVLDKDYKLNYVIEHSTDHGHEPWDPSSLNWIPDLPEPVKAEGCIECHSFRIGHAPFNKSTIQEVYVNALGQVVPCCFIGNALQGQINSPDIMQIRKIQESIGNHNNLHNYSLQEIFDNKIFDIFSNSWQNKSIPMCWYQCGKSNAKDPKMNGLFAEVIPIYEQ